MLFRSLDLIYDRRVLENGELKHDPLTEFLNIFAEIDGGSIKVSKTDELATLDLPERLRRRIIDGEKNGLEKDLQEALDSGKSAIAVINEDLLDGMREVGELFGRGEMQLPFVLQSAETMKAAVGFLEKFMEKRESQERGSILLEIGRAHV